MREKFLIVLVDDDVDDQELMRRGLKDCKVLVEIVALNNGLQLMDYLLRRESYKNTKGVPDLILLDLNMPLMDGFATLKELRKYKHLRSIPLYVITTSRSKDDKTKALELGATGFYSKGSSSRDVKKIMQEICSECFE
jgi:CheY-like chemotaxis protein